jgi:glycosyltransferase involved in cell wall biosynthesis
LLGQCDVLVLPSYFEGLALVQLEALAAGLPIIATEATGAPDLITDGVEGYIIPTGDGDALRDAMQKFISSPEKAARMSQAARHCAERYSWDAYGERWMGILRQLA